MIVKQMLYGVQAEREEGDYHYTDADMEPHD